MALIETQHLTKVYDLGDSAVHALDDVSLTVAHGEFVAIMGPSGSGKSTFMNLIGCLDVPTGGQYLLDGMDVGDRDRDELAEIRNKKIGFVFQAFHLLPGVTTADNVMMPLLYCENVPPDARVRACRMLEKVGLGHRLDHTSGKLSGGEQQRVTIARALINDPKIVLADEPTGNLDSKNGAEIMKLLDSLNREGRTIIIITHDPKVAQHGHRTISLMDGKIEEDRYHENVQEFAASPSRGDRQ